MFAGYFSPDYFTARQRFQDAAVKAGAACHSIPIASQGPGGEELAIDVALLGDVRPQRTVVVSSGLHGVEGFFGSAIQTAWLDERREFSLPAGTRLALVHALNPFGFAWRRRWNEDNVDLNRNFVLSGEEYAGAPPLYVQLEKLLNPPSSPSRWEPILTKGLLAMLRFGASNLAQAIPVGQYEFPQGLFYGGRGPAETLRLVEHRLADWLGDAREIWHIDLHSGLGKFGSYQLLVDAPLNDARVLRLVERFGKDSVSPNRLTEGPGRSGVIYASRGTWEKWCLARFPERAYHFATAEFGTYSGARVIAALRAENSAWHFAKRHDPAYEWTRTAVVYAFAPPSQAWREAVVRQGIELIDRATS